MNKPTSELPEELESAKQIFLSAIYGAESEVINSDAANRPDVKANIKRRLNEVNNECRGNVTRALKKDPRVSRSTKKLAEILEKKLLALTAIDTQNP